MPSLQADCTTFHARTEAGTPDMQFVLKISHSQCKTSSYV